MRCFWFYSGERFGDRVHVSVDLDVVPALNHFPIGANQIRRPRDAHGFAIDAGVAAVVNGFEVGFGVNGIANRINWDNVEQTSYALGNLFLGGDFVESGPFLSNDVRVELPKDYHVNAGYHADVWSVMSEYGHGFQGDTLRGGAEYRAGVIEFRGGGVYSREMWNPTGGVGLNFSPKVGLDVAMFSTAANAARERRPALAVSLRINAR